MWLKTGRYGNWPLAVGQRTIVVSSVCMSVTTLLHVVQGLIICTSFAWVCLDTSKKLITFLYIWLAIWTTSWDARLCILIWLCVHQCPCYIFIMRCKCNDLLFNFDATGLVAWVLWVNAWICCAANPRFRTHISHKAIDAILLGRLSIILGTAASVWYVRQLVLWPGDCRVFTKAR